MTARSFEQTVDVETPELVVLTYSVAGIGSRVLAAVTDLLICAVALSLFGIAITLLGVRTLRLDRSASWTVAVIMLAQFVFLWGYYVLFEGLMDGQTPGKRLHRLRVVRESGHSVSFGVSAVRNLVRLLDMQPGLFYAVGLGSMMLTKRGRRLGDLAAGTIVVREDFRAAPPPRAARRPQARSAALHTALTEAQYVVLGRFVERWGTLDAARRASLATQMAVHLAAALPGDGRSAGARLLELHEREREARGQGVASRGETGAARERQAIVAQGQPRWTAFAAQLAVAQRRGLSAMTEAHVRDFVAEYRALSADFARLRTASRDSATDELFTLGRLVAGAHNLIYRERGAGLRGMLRMLFWDVPMEVRRSAAPIALAALLLFGPAVVAGVSIVHAPEVATRLVPPAMIERAERGVRRARNGEGYIDDPQMLRPVMASAIVTNNVQVTFAVFAGGLSFGLLSALMLILNGISIGSVMGLFASKGIASLLIAFVAPHGVLELFAICVAGGGGFLLASGLLIPGPRTRRRALVDQGRRAARLIAASTFLLVIAGALEGLVSPIEWWPLEGKLAVSAVTLVFLVSYVRGSFARPALTVRPVP